MGCCHADPTVLVIGDVMCDVYLWGTIERISPEAPVPIFQCQERQYVLGGAANVAANLQALGCRRTVIRRGGSGHGWTTCAPPVAGAGPG